MLLKKRYSIAQKLKELQLRRSASHGAVYMFHDVTENATNGMYSIGIENFEHLLNILMGKGEIIPSYKLKEQADTPRFVITFDDAFENVFLLAYPVLKRMKCPFTVFMSLEYLNKPGYLSETMLTEMSKSGLCTLGYHAAEHVLFRPVNASEKRHLIEDGREKMELIAERAIQDFAFPYGSVYAVDPLSIKIAGQCYERVYMTLSAHYNRENIKKLNYIPRINVNDMSIKHIGEELQSGNGKEIR